MAQRDELMSSEQRAEALATSEHGADVVTELATRVRTSIASRRRLAHSSDPDALQALEARYKALVLATGQITWVARSADGSDGVVFADGRDWRLFTGQSAEEMRTAGWMDAIHPDDRPRVSAAWTAAVTAKSPFETDYRVRRQDGVYRWLLTRGVPILEADGAVREWVGTATDITARREADAALRETEARLAEELAAAQRLQAISSQLILEGNLDTLYEQLVDAAIALMRSDMGSMQMLYPERNELRLLAWQGFDPRSAAFWEWVRMDSPSSCGVAFSRAERVIVPDVKAATSLVGTEDLRYFRLSGIQAMQSTPLVSRSGRLVGMISTHWRTPHQPSEQALRQLDVLARQAADLIERKQAEKNSAHLAAIVASTSDAVLSKTLEGVITSWNASAERMFGYTATEIIGRNIRVLIPADRQYEEDRIIARLRAGERVEHFETIRLTKDGHPLQVSLTISPMRDESGTVVGASKIIRDITEAKRTEQLLAEQNALLELIASGRPLDECLSALTSAVGRMQPKMRAAVLLADAEHTKLAISYSSNIPRSFGEQFEGIPLADLDIATCVAAVRTGKPTSCDDIAHDTRWSQQWREACLEHDIRACHSQPIIGSDDRQPLASLMLCFDEPRKPDAWDLRIAHFGAHIASIAIERDRAEEAARESERRKDEFLGIASHELRTPLTSITANVQMAERTLKMLSPSAPSTDSGDAASADDAYQLPADKRQRVRRLLENTDTQLGRLARLVNDLLDVSRIQAGKLELRPEPFDLCDVVREAVEAQRAVWVDRSIALETEESTLPLVADPDRIGQVVTNYLTNALKYSAEDQPVRVVVRLTGGQARVEVCDRGPGLTPEQQQRVFESFYRAPGIEQRSGAGAGLGLGLHICKTIIERHGGDVGVEGAPGVGSEFWFTLPTCGEVTEE